MSRRTAAALMLLCTLVAAATAAPVTLTIGAKYQTVDGFGSHHNLNAWKVKVGPFYQTVDLVESGFYDSIANDMQIMRLGIPQMQSSEGGAYSDVSFPHAAALAQRGMTKFFGSSWSPPAFMKSNNSVSGGGSLLTQYYDDFGRMCAEYCRQFKEKVGVDLYAISLQNEPLFSEPYASCVYNNSTYKELVKVAAPIIQATSPNTKILGAEDVLVAASRCNGWVNTILSDAQAAPYFDIYAVHCHTQIFEDPTDQYRGWWNTVRTVADPNGFPLWMTETGDNFDTTWNTAVKLCATITNSFKYGNCTAWIWWILARDSDENAMILNGAYTGKYYQMAHFGRFVKPGARRIESSSGDSQLREVAFENTDGTVVVVVVNKTNSARSASIAGSGLPGQFTAHQSTLGSPMQNLGTQSASTEVSLPAQSMTTFTSGTTSTRHRSVSAEAKPVRQWCGATGDGAGLVLDLPAAGRAGIAVYTTQGRLVAHINRDLGAGRTIIPVRRTGPAEFGARALLVCRVEVISDGSRPMEHTVHLQ